MMHAQSKIIQILFVVLLLALAVAFWLRPTAPFPLGEWVLVEIGGHAPLSGTQVTFDLSEHLFSGFSGCNDYGGQVVFLRNGRLKITGVESTAEACLEPDGVMEQEAEYFSRLGLVSAFEQSPERLVLWNPENIVQLVFVPRVRHTPAPSQLSGSSWRWESIDGASIVSKPSIEIRFADGLLSGFTGCRYLTGAYVSEQDHLQITELRMHAAGCSDPAQQAIEARFLDTLDLFDVYLFEGPDLVVELATGTRLVFSPVQMEAADPAAAELTLRRFFERLSSGDFSAAASLYGGPHEIILTLRDYNPEIDPEDIAALLEAGCSFQFRCLEIGEIVHVEQLPYGFHIFTVTFGNPDGSPFVLGPCCGSDEPMPETPTEYQYLVSETEGGLRIYGGLVYVP